MTPEERIDWLERELTDTRYRAAQLAADLLASYAPEKLAVAAESLDTWAEHPEASKSSARLATQIAAALREEMREAGEPGRTSAAQESPAAVNPPASCP